MTPNAKVWDYVLDPSDQVDFSIDVSPLLEEGEKLSSFSLYLPAESELYGLTLGTGEREAYLDGNKIVLWLSMTKNPENDVTLPVEYTIITSSSPSRRKQRTAGVKVSQL